MPPSQACTGLQALMWVENYGFGFARSDLCGPMTFAMAEQHGWCPHSMSLAGEASAYTSLVVVEGDFFLGHGAGQQRCLDLLQVVRTPGPIFGLKVLTPFHPGKENLLWQRQRVPQAVHQACQKQSRYRSHSLLIWVAHCIRWRQCSEEAGHSPAL